MDWKNRLGNCVRVRKINDSIYDISLIQNEETLCEIDRVDNESIHITMHYNGTRKEFQLRSNDKIRIIEL